MNTEQQIAEALDAIAIHIKYLGNGDAGTTMGAVENLSIQVKSVADAILVLAEAVQDHA